MLLFRALRERKSSREFATTELRSDDLSNMLWAGFGVSRPDGHRTAPPARDCQGIDIFVALRRGLYLCTSMRCVKSTLGIFGRRWVSRTIWQQRR
jgi:hypothetical protein